MEKKQVLKGLATVIFYAASHEKAIKWYSELLGIEPYFNVPGYSEFRIGDYEHELGIIDRKYAPKGYSPNPSGAIIFWHVDHLQATLELLISMGAKEYEPVTDRTEGFVTASVVDPFGNVLGIMHNPHYLDILKQKSI
jgi:predicted enzyme related to lactoylglutathione lyase